MADDMADARGGSQSGDKMPDASQSSSLTETPRGTSLGDQIRLRGQNAKWPIYADTGSSEGNARVIEDALSSWRAKNGGVMPHTIVYLQKIDRKQQFEAQHNLDWDPCLREEDVVHRGDAGRKKYDETDTLAMEMKEVKKARRGKGKRKAKQMLEDDTPGPASGSTDSSQKKGVEKKEELATKTGTLSPMACANCGRTDHHMMSCPGPVDLATGTLRGCVVHNTKDHEYDECPVTPAWNAGQHYNYLVFCRRGLAPVHTTIPWWSLAAKFQNDRLSAYPLRRSHAKRVTAEMVEAWLASPDTRASQIVGDALTESLETVLENLVSLEKTEPLHSTAEG
ncbi:hypothetical protein F4778DRAFT_796230 [Xylariomycetidae sp. FL2044]|nr:hypothetical protein F4778DRAFT_796230 [Xylariomycetidae sp. FL2044]